MRVADGVGIEVDGDVVYAAPLPDGPIMVLQGVAALIWTVSAGLERGDVAGVVAERTGADVASIRADIDAFLREMLERGLLVED
ncbi:Coenzyme PQQ synthesis protein D (PqqD) [Microbacterium sp. cf046]|uniref:PqqD family protein n=1 Tax=Microbacterium sp. cf046 TaxID=1761803 RepID=UPI0008EB162A|nr:PqqD family protein [Microbacterium sp. cf046]SFR90868.1 Coenzyme PQQ synthesis protein D (PqqD) [Microbacterium sp. cf046]